MKPAASVTLKTPGLSVKWTKVGHRLYADVIHDKSSIPARQFREPIEGGKRRFVKAVDEAVKGFDWTRDAAEIAKDAGARAALWSIHEEKPAHRF